MNGLVGGLSRGSSGSPLNPALLLAVIAVWN